MDVWEWVENLAADPCFLYIYRFDTGLTLQKVRISDRMRVYRSYKVVKIVC